MDWETVAELILKEGLPVGIQIAQWWQAKTIPTDAMWADLLTKGQQMAKQRMLLALTQNGVDPASPQGQALLALVV